MSNADFSLPSGTDRIELLQTFVRIVESGSLSAAAQQMATTQPTVSRRLQALERALGLRLLRRSTHAMALTEDGERCLAHARELLGAWQALETDLQGAQDTPRGLLRVVAPHAFGQDQLMAPLLAFLDRYPGVRVEWLLHDRQPDFIAEGIDCAVQVGAVVDPSVIALRVAEVPRIAVAAPQLLGQGAIPRHPRELQALPWLALRTFYQRELELYRADAARQPSESWRLQFDPRMSTDSLYALRNAALGGLGAALVSAWIVREDLAAGRLVQLAPGWQASPLPVHLVYPPVRHPPARLRAFIDAMREVMPGLTGMRAPLR
ncbi:D-malate degradation protein R [Delftia tsuruhatensis]|uniref:LysR family transcriptional regulator n=1 Tax=Delftia tsuruhatensis TaxID=180282 RepID=UPI001E7C6E04|nr:LysR family transcriptional regulator [Delftia tsuruhatensis]CAB5711467.1 D-malate degradation protein R [Delftia tsuruhatensis]CAC9686802.1 D-malate degradation protein R [Delftia tsuruhatensis]